MKTRKLLPFILAVALAGCIPSLHPLFTEDDLIFEPKLLGTWAKSKETKEWNAQLRPIWEDDSDRLRGTSPPKEIKPKVWVIPSDLDELRD